MTSDTSTMRAPRRPMTRKGRRLALIGVGVAVLSIAAGMVLFALRDTIVFFHSPSDIVQKGVQPGTRLRLGGLVREASVERIGSQDVRFIVHDGSNNVTVSYRGQLPDLFREGQGVVTEGVLQSSGAFLADTVLAKHDESYMPREVADALKKQGVWQGDGAKPQAGQPGIQPNVQQGTPK